MTDFEVFMKQQGRIQEFLMRGEGARGANWGGKYSNKPNTYKRAEKESYKVVNSNLLAF